jgi:hypothetical protein
MFMMKISEKMDNHSVGLYPGMCAYEAGALSTSLNWSAEFLEDDEGGNVRFMI